jgi:hypothetical protein
MDDDIWKAIIGHGETMRQRKTRGTAVTEDRSKAFGMASAQEASTQIMAVDTFRRKRLNFAANLGN